MKLSPKELFPTQSANSIQESKILFFMECLRNNVEVPQINVIRFEDDYYIIAGHHLMLALNRLAINETDVEVITPGEETFWGIRDNIIESLKAIGQTALYDYEAIGAFTYKNIQVGIKRIKNGKDSYNN